jgi:septal ring factor EnvC (AmiA/AmiB activator)
LTRAGVCALLVASLAASPSWVQAQQSKPEELRELRQRIDRLKQDLTAAEGARSEAVEALRESEQQISAANRRLRELGAEREKVRAELARITGETRQLQADVMARRQRLARLLYARYTEGEHSLLRALLAGDDPHGAARALVYQSYISRAEAQMIQQGREDLARLGALDVATREQSEALAAIERASRAERDTLRAKVAERRQLVARLAGDIKRGRKDLATAQQNETRLTRLIQELARAAKPPPRAGAKRPERDRTPVLGAFGGLKGQLRPPVRGEFAARFGDSKEMPVPSRKGVFFRAPEGEEVRAIAPGRIVFADWMRGYGNLVILDHGDGYLSIYGNNESVLKRVGDAVHAGDAVATVGASGGNDTSGLYFELRHQGKAFDPVPWLRVK